MKILIFILLCISISKFIYAKSTTSERENFVNYIVEQEHSKEWIDFLILKKLNIIQKIYKNKGIDESFVDNFKAKHSIPIIDPLFISKIRHQAHITKDPVIQLLLGVIYTGNFLKNRNYNLGLNYLILSAEKKNIDAQNQLCSEYSNGIYIPIDLAEQTRWCSKIKK